MAPIDSSPVCRLHRDRADLPPTYLGHAPAVTRHDATGLRHQPSVDRPERSRSGTDAWGTTSRHHSRLGQHGSRARTGARHGGPLRHRRRSVAMRAAPVAKSVAAEPECGRPVRPLGDARLLFDHGVEGSSTRPPQVGSDVRRMLQARAPGDPQGRRRDPMTAGTLIVDQGQMGREAFVRARRRRRPCAERSQGRHRSVRAPSSASSHCSITVRVRRSVVCDTDCTLFVLDQRHFQQVIEHSPPIAMKLLGTPRRPHPRPRSPVLRLTRGRADAGCPTPR